MNAQTVLYTIAVFFSTVLPSLWISNQNLEPYTLQGCGALVLLYIVFKKFFKVQYQNIITLLFLNTLVQTLVLSTGKTSSPLFFLYYFILFAFAVTFEKYLVLLVTLSTVAIYIYQQPSLISGLDYSSTNLLSLLLITPLAELYSKAVIKNAISNERIQNLQEDLSQTETDSLLWLSTESKPALNQVISSVTDLIIYLKSTRSKNSLPVSFLNKLRSIQSDLMTLYSSADILEEDIKLKTDNKKN